VIGIFDSGVGGLAVLRETRRLLPAADLTYVADQAHAPYGERSLDEVRGLADGVASFLISLGAGTVVIACNTASAAAVHQLRAEHPDTPFVGIEPAVKPAAAITRSGVVGVLATPATFQGKLFADLVARHGNGVDVRTQPCPGLAASVEESPPDDPGTRALLEGYVRPLTEAGADILVLGCTHYAFLVDAIAALAGDEVTVIDPAPAVARQAARVAGGEEGGGITRYLTTGDPGRFAAQIRRLLGETVTTERIEI
jgi:glutamate racemase